MIREEYAPERLKEMILEIPEGVVGVQWIGRGSRKKIVWCSEERGKDGAYVSEF